MQTKWIRAKPLFSKIWFFLVFLFLLVVIPLIVVSAWFNWATAPVSKEGEEKSFVIELNEGVSSIGERLKKEGLIRDELVFSFYTRFSCEGVSLFDPLSLLKRQNCLSEKIQAGTFKLSPTDDLATLAGKLTEGKPLDTWAKILEGTRVEEIAKTLAEKFPFSQEEFLALAQEGYMFPDTYLFKTESTAKEIVTKMRETFDLRFTQELKDKAAAQNLTLEEAVILASLVERETRSDDERPVIAGILLKRLREGWRLEVDATIQYALGYDEIGKTWWKKSLPTEDLAVISPYNTRTHSGLPPGPICNPGLSALKAVAEPVESEYYFYLHDKEGKVHYGRTLQEHNANK